MKPQISVTTIHYEPPKLGGSFIDWVKNKFRPHNKPRPRPRPVPVPPAPVPMDMAKLMTLINMERASRGVVRLAVNNLLVGTAQSHSYDMNIHHKLTHDSSDGSSFADRFDAVGYAYAFGTEIIAFTNGLPFNEGDVVALWLNSPAHKAAMLSPQATEMGAGKSGDYWTVDFGRPSEKDKR